MVLSCRRLTIAINATAQPVTRDQVEGSGIAASTESPTGELNPDTSEALTNVPEVVYSAIVPLPPPLVTNRFVPAIATL